MINNQQNSSKLALSQQKTTQLSLQFFTQVPQLYLIEQGFALSQIDHQLAVRDLDSQFELIRAMTETKKHKQRLRANNVVQNKKNRYPQQSIYQHSRVKLLNENRQQYQQKRINNNYINANFIERQNKQNYLILTQAPLKQTLVDFIQIICQNYIQCVVMVCNFVQNGKNKCYDYLNSQYFGNCQEVPNSYNNIKIKKIKIKRQSGGNSQQNYHQITHIFYQSWPDKNVPQNPLEITPIITQMIKFNRILVHCSAGLGRSGVMAVLYKIIKQNNKKTKEQKLNDKISIFKVMREIREDRYGAVQNNQQYKFIYQYIKCYRDLLVNNQIE